VSVWDGPPVMKHEITASYFFVVRSGVAPRASCRNNMFGRLSPKTPQVAAAAPALIMSRRVVQIASLQSC
jgi:hypothetical protein